MNTAFLLAARYDGLPTITAERVCADFFPHLNLQTFYRRLDEGTIALPVTRLDGSQKAPRVIGLIDLAAFIDKATEQGRKEIARKT